MIRHAHTLQGPPVRRIAVIQIPRGQVSRLGTIMRRDWIAGPNTVSLNTWSPVKDLAPHMLRNASSMTPEAWQAELLQRQSMTALQTPGTLTYTPAPGNPSGATVEAPWTLWGGCGSQAGSLQSFGITSPAAMAAASIPPPPKPTTNSSGWLIAAGILGAAASLMYLKQSTKGNR